MKVVSALLFSLSCITLTLAARETLEEAAIHTRELLLHRTYNIGTLISSYHEDTAPYSDLAGAPIGLQEYYAPFPSLRVGEKEDVGDLLLLAMPIAKIFRNVLPPYRNNITFTISDLYGLGHGNLAAGRMRIALFGSLERVPDSQTKICEEAYLAAHKDSRGWVPPNGPHNAFYARLRVSRVYDFGGFGDVAYIGFIPLPLYISSIENVRSKKEVLSEWPEPIQPDGVFGWQRGLWDENGWGGEEFVPQVESGDEGESGKEMDRVESEEDSQKENRFRVQW